MSRASTLLAVTAIACAVPACKRDTPAPAVTQPVASAAASSAPTAPLPLAQRPVRTPAAEAFTVTTSDGVILQGDLVRSPDPGVPAVILAPRWAGTREGYKPLLDRLSRAKPAPHVLALDLRGHGGSTKRTAEGKTIAWSALDKADYAAMPKDFVATFAGLDKQLGAGLPAFILVGADIGGTMSAIAAGAERRVSAVAVLMPGSSLKGVDIYRPFALIRDRTTLIAGAAADTVSTEPLVALASMAKAGTVKRYASDDHVLERVAEANPALWDDVAAWILGPAMDAKPPTTLAEPAGSVAPAGSVSPHAAPAASHK